MKFGIFFCFSEEVATLKQSETTLKQQNVDSQRRERLLVRRLATKEQEMQDYMVSTLTSEFPLIVL